MAGSILPLLDIYEQMICYINIYIYTGWWFLTILKHISQWEG